MYATREPPPFSCLNQLRSPCFIPSDVSVWQAINSLVRASLLRSNLLKCKQHEAKWSQSCFGYLPSPLSSLLWTLENNEQAELLIASVVASTSNATFRHGTSDATQTFQSRLLEHKRSWNLPYQYVNLANRSPCDIIKKMADFQDNSDRKLWIFAFLHVSIVILSITMVFTQGTTSFSKIKKNSCMSVAL